MNLQQLLDELTQIQKGLEDKSIATDARVLVLADILGVILEDFKLQEEAQRVFGGRGVASPDEIGEFNRDEAPLLRRAEEVFHSIKEMLGNHDSEEEF